MDGRLYRQNLKVSPSCIPMERLLDSGRRLLQPFTFSLKARRFLPLVFPFILWCLPAVAQPSRVLVVINEVSPGSVLVGEKYALSRGIDPGQICRIRTEVQPSVNRRTYDEEIRNPVARCLASHKLQDRVLYIVTTFGLPLWVEGQGGPVGDLATVDSELSALYQYLAGERMVTFGRTENPYFTSQVRPGEWRPFKREEYPGYLVTRLTGKTVEDALALIERGKVSASSGTIGIDLPGQRSTMTRGWLMSAAEQLRTARMTVEVEETSAPFRTTSALVALAVDLNGSNDISAEHTWAPGAMAFILGPQQASPVPSLPPPGGKPEDKNGPNRGQGQSAAESGSQPESEEQGGNPESSPAETGPEVEQPLDPNHPGSGSGIRDSEFTDPSSFPALDFIASGATGSVIFVGDPTEDGYPRPQVLLPAYFAGYNLAESFYQSLRYLSWRQVVIGDPLARVAPGRKTPSWQDQTDPRTGLPFHFSKRRLENLQVRLHTGTEALVLLLKAEAAADAGNLDLALTSLDESIQLDSRVSEALTLRARLLEGQRRFEEAFADYSTALQLRIRDEEALRRRLAHISLEELKDFVKAEEHVRWLFARSGFTDLETTRMWARVKFGKGEFEQAEAIYLRLLRETSPPPDFAYQGLGDVYSAQGNTELAKRFYDRSSQSPDSATPSAEDSKDPAPALPPPQPGSFSPSTVRARILEQSMPVPPKSKLRKGAQSSVELRLLIDEQGQLVKVEPVSGEKALVKAAVAAVWTWRFAPKLVNGKGEVDQISVVIDFGE